MNTRLMWIYIFANRNAHAYEYRAISFVCAVRLCHLLILCAIWRDRTHPHPICIRNNQFYLLFLLWIPTITFQLDTTHMLLILDYKMKTVMDSLSVALLSYLMKWAIYFIPCNNINWILFQIQIVFECKFRLEFPTTWGYWSFCLHFRSCLFVETAMGVSIDAQSKPNSPYVQAVKEWVQ